jgi:predicted glycosyltransferase
VASPKIIFYCQHLLGIGHLTRSLNICQQLVKGSEVHFIQGGPDVGKTIDHPNFHHHFLTPLQMNEADAKIFVYDKSCTMEEAWENRLNQLRNLPLEGAQELLIELFPFGRKKFTDEITTFIAEIKKAQPKLTVSCSLRDILVEKHEQARREAKMVEHIDNYYDRIYVHSDPKYVPLDLTFKAIESIRDKIQYTGYICEAAPQPAAKRNNEILVSVGGGIVGSDLVEACIAVAPKFSNHSFRIVVSPNMPDKTKEMIRENTVANIVVQEFTNKYEKILSESALSISLAGYNTTMNILNTKTPSLMFPYQRSTEQLLRTSILANGGFVHELTPEDLEISNLASKIEAALKSTYPEVPIDLNGSENTAKITLRHL